MQHVLPLLPPRPVLVVPDSYRGPWNGDANLGRLSHSPRITPKPSTSGTWSSDWNIIQPRAAVATGHHALSLRARSRDLLHAMQFRAPPPPQVSGVRPCPAAFPSDRDYPPDTAGDRSLWHAGGTAGENDDARTRRRRLPPQPLGEARPHSPLLRGQAVEDGTAAGSDLVGVGDMGGIELAVGGPTDVGFGCRLTTVVVPAVQSACGASAAQRVHCSPDPSGGRARRG
jgi:hypothetical protein